MEFYDPIVGDAETKVADHEENRTEEAVLKLEDEIDRMYGVIQGKFSSLWTNTANSAKEISEKNSLMAHKESLLNQLNDAKENINNKSQLRETLSHIEKQLKSPHVPEVNLKGIQGQANNALDNLDSTLEKVEKQAGAYMNQFTSFFSNIIQVSPEEEAESDSKKETIFSSSLTDREQYGTSRFESELFKLHTEKALYLSNDLDQEEELEEFKADDKTHEILHLLEQYPNTLTTLMNSLVPVDISCNTFWYRYFKNEQKLKDEEKVRKEILTEKHSDKKSKDSEHTEVNVSDQESFDWDDEDGDVVDVGKEAINTSSELKTPSSEGDDFDDDDDWE